MPGSWRPWGLPNRLLRRMDELVSGQVQFVLPLPWQVLWKVAEDVVGGTGDYSRLVERQIERGLS